MPYCQYCGQSFKTDGAFAAHLDTDHDRDELSRIDRKRVRSHKSEGGLTGSAIGGITRRQALGIGSLLAGIGGVGVVANRWVLGGDETGGAGRTASLEGEWTTGPELPYRAEYPAVTVYDGEMYVFGGADEENVPQAEAYRYAPEDETWTKLGPMPVEGQESPRPDSARRST